MSEQSFEEFIHYESVNDRYFSRRRLRKSAGAPLLWALGVGAVISGDFSGWNLGLAVGGFWGLAIATFLMAIMYICMVYCVAEMSTALPHAGGFYSFTRNAFGPFAGFLCGATMTIEYVLTPAVIVFFIGSYLNTLLPNVPVALWWLLFYGVFVAINIHSTRLTLKVGFFITLIAAIILLIFYYHAFINVFKPELLFNIPPDPGQSATWLPKGWSGVFKAFPYAIWFYLAIEELPLAAEEAREPSQDLPDALAWGMYTLIFFSLFTLVVNSGVAGGAVAIGKSSAPMVDGLKAAFGEGPLTVALTVAALAGLIASFHTVMYGYGRVLFSLSRAGYFPRWISVTSKSHTPARALILGAVVGLACTATIQIAGQGVVGAALLNMAVFGAVISYALVMSSYIKLKISRPDLQRPYKSPLGIWGAAVGTALAILALFACFSDPAYQPGIWGVAIFLFAAILYFLFYSRSHLVAQAPEEEAALLAGVVLR
ncbi:MAG: ethanolamine permease [Gloeocapsa sp. UFS-A4-WI-NPMV-4B04]|jgi:ethanolamine permease|nr:ethanolamine permease [Gloeocapsa sp. UFS-A4-WI-NPMV-4B04]